MSPNIDEQDESLVPETSESKEGKLNKVGKKASDGASKLLKKMAQKTGKTAAKKASLGVAMGPVIFWGAIIIVCIIIIVGIIMFFATMPGMVMEKIKALFNKLGVLVSTFFGADATEVIPDEEIFGTLDYLEEMGYDLKGFGFLTGYYDDSEKSIEEIENALSSEEKNNYKIDNKIGVVRSTLDGNKDKIILAKSDFIFTYIASDNYVYTLKNDNIATIRDDWDSIWNVFKNLFSAITTARYKIQNFVFGPINDILGITDFVQDTWGKGLVAFYYEGGGLGKRGSAVNTGTLWNWDTVEIKMKSKKLVIAKNELFNTNNPIEYNLDGWTGRYGMPAEFLISVHLATMMPDLSYNMATGFNTNINMYMRTSEGKVEVFFKNENNQNIRYSDLYYLNPNNKYDLVKIFDEYQICPKEHLEGNCSCKKCITVEDVVEGDFEGSRIYDEEGELLDPEEIDYDKHIESRDGGITWYVVEEAEEDYYQIIDPNCANYAKAVLNKMSENYDGDYKTYTPYIADVTDHWYRDVYYTIDLSDKKNKNKNFEFVKYDDEYELLMKERWSLYETYPDGNEKANEIKLYVITPEGEYATLDDLKKYYPNDAFDANDNLIKELSNDTVNPNYYLFDGTKKDAENKNLIVSKKAVTIKLQNISGDDNESMEDLGWHNSKNVWSAYEESTESYTGPINPAFPGSSDEIEQKIYTQVQLATGNIKQTGEGQRGETNSKIKKMFLNNTYFRYTGNAEVAENITALRETIKEDKLGGKKGIAYGPLNNLITSKGKSFDATELTYTKADLFDNVNEDERDNIYSVKDYSGQVVLNQDSLNAFSMLENTHTLDADYIYRDFKELIVELGYFTKEELTDETPRLLEWLVPDAGSSGYPDRTIDKRENEYGTMVHSRGDISANKVYTTKELLEEMYNSEEEVDPEYDAYDEDVVTPDTLAQVPTQRQDNIRNLVGITANDFFSDFSHVDTSLLAGITKEEFMEKADEIYTYMYEVGYDYCVYRRADTCDRCTEECKAAAIAAGTGSCSCNCGKIHCKHTVHPGECGLCRTFEASKTNQTTNCVCCATYVSWVLKEVGIDVDGIMETYGGNMHGAQSVSRMCVEYLGGEIITEFNELKPGDIMAYVRKGKGSIGHVDIIAKKVDGGYKKYNGGTPIPKGRTLDDSATFTEKNFNDNDLCFGIRLFDKGDQSEYVGYDGNEAVVSPVTGILLEYGTYDPDINTGKDIDSITNEEYRLNVDLKYGPMAKNSNEQIPFESKNVSDKVGYAKILVLDREYYKTLEDSIPNNSWNTENGGQSLVNPNGTFREVLIDEPDSSAASKLKKDGWSEIDKTVYGYKEFAELYEKSGIAGYIIYIDGFVCEVPDKNLKSDDSVSKMIPYEGREEDKQNARISTDEANSNLVGYSYKTVTPENFTDNKLQLISKYEEDDDYKTSSEKTTNKLKAETEVKVKASNSMYLAEEDIIFIKEGTILGRTMTDKELLESEDFRNSKYGNYEENRKHSSGDKNAFDNIIGNYVRIVMRDISGVVVENVEDYMKLDRVNDLEWFELFYWTPLVSGGADILGFGPEYVCCPTPGEIGVGLVQWTDITRLYHSKSTSGIIVNSFGLECYEKNPTLCEPLRAISSLSVDELWMDTSGDDDGTMYAPCVKNGVPSFKNDPTGTLREYCYDCIQKSLLQDALTTICEDDREGFLKIQMEVAKEQYLDPVLQKYAWLEERPECVQGAIMYVQNACGVKDGMAFVKSEINESLSDEEILQKVREKIATITTTEGNKDETNAWNVSEIALGILDGRLSKYDVEEWVRTADDSILTQYGVEYR